MVRGTTSNHMLKLPQTSALQPIGLARSAAWSAAKFAEKSLARPLDVIFPKPAGLLFWLFLP